MALFRIIVAFLLTVALTLQSAGMAAENSATITLNFKDSDIREVAASIGQITGKNFIVDPRVKGRVTVISAQPISTEAVYATFLSVLQVHGFAAIPAEGNTVKIVPAVDARQLPGAQQVPIPYQGPGDEVVTQVLEVQYVPAAQLVAILRPLVPQHGHLAAYQPSNMLIISDTAANVERIARIVRRIDQSSDDDIEVIALQHASATEVVRVLTALNQGAAREGGGNITMVADERTNSILVGGDKNERLRLTAIISHLDTPLEQGGDTQVVYLNYADAENISTILKGYSTETQQTSSGQGGGASGATGTEVSIIPDTDTNALVITAPPKLMRSIRSVISKLDIRRAQVMVEAIIVEISSEKAAELGVTWAADASDEHGVVGLTNFSGSGVGVVQFAGAAQSGNFSSLPDGISLGFGRIESGRFSFAGLLRALAGDGTTNILSTPTLMTMDNEEAEIQVGQEVPFITGQFSTIGTGTGTGGTSPVNPFQTIQRKEVGVQLKIKPQINEGNAVIMQIEQEVSSIASGATGAADLITNKRTIKTRVIAESGTIVVLGGLIDDQLIESEQRVPILGSIPVLGNLFRYRSTQKTKRNLMVFLQPTVLTDGIQASHLTESKYNYIRAEQLRVHEDDVQLMPGAVRPMLPPIEEKRAESAVPPPAAVPVLDENKDAEPDNDATDQDDGNATAQ